MITDSCQRWTEGRESRRPAGETIRTAEYEVAPIGPLVAKAFVRAHHYSHECSPTAHPFGLFHRAELAGVAVFGPTASKNAHAKIFPTLTQKEAVTLGRLVLLDGVPANGESWFVARCFELLRGRGIVAVESCADPIPRAGADGRVVHHGHVGTIYQALSGRYVGRTNPASLRLLPDGTILSNRSQGKIFADERGQTTPVNQLVRHGAPAPRADEDVEAWLRTWRRALTTAFRHKGNVRYVWSLSRRYRRELEKLPALPYPKIATFAA